MKTTSESHQFLGSRRIRNPFARWLSFFVPKQMHSSQGEAAPVVILTGEKCRLPDRGDFESDNDCACE